MKRIYTWIIDWLQLVKLSIRMQSGRRYWVAPLLVLGWPMFLAFRSLTGMRVTDYRPIEAQNFIIGLPLIVLAIGLGVRVIAGEIEQRTLEVSYTVPGGSHRIWIAKLAAIFVILVIAEGLLTLAAALFFTSVSWSACYGAMQGAVFYLVLAMAFGALMRSEITAAMLSAVVLVLNGFLTGFGNIPNRLSPLFNPLTLDETSSSQVLAWTVQNRIGMALLIIGIAALTFSRAERRERLLGS